MRQTAVQVVNLIFVVDNLSLLLCRTCEDEPVTFHSFYRRRLSMTGHKLALLQVVLNAQISHVCEVVMKLLCFRRFIIFTTPLGYPRATNQAKFVHSANILSSGGLNFAYDGGSARSVQFHMHLYCHMFLLTEVLSL